MRFFPAFVALTSSLLVVDAGDNRTASAFIRYKIVPDIITTPPQNQLYARFPSGAQVRLGNSLSPGKVGRRLGAVMSRTAVRCTGLHRYVLLAYSQTAPISPQYTGYDGFNVEDFIKDNNLQQPPVAGNFFRAQYDGSV